MANENQKKSIISLFIPQKGDTKAEFIRKTVLLVAIAVVIVCAVLITIELTSTQSDINQTQDLLNKVDDFEKTGEFQIEEEKVEEIKKEIPEIQDKFVDLYAENPDLVGRVIIGDIIDYPVYQTDDNDYYLNHDALGNETVSGAIFADYYTPVTYNSNVGNQILYGHNLLAGTYFSKLTYYYPHRPETDGIEYYKQYPTLEFDTLYEDATYKIFAGCFFNCDESDGLVYPYHWVHYFDNEYEFMEFIGNIMDRSSFYTGVDLEYGDEILTLSTCYYYPLGKEHNTRFALFARKVREGESTEVDVSKAYINNDPLMFDAYYNGTGAPRWQGRTWDTSLVKNFDNYDIDSLVSVKPRLLADKDEVKYSNTLN